MADSCLLLLARAEDSSVRALERRGSHRVVRASIADLTCAGWQYLAGLPERATAYADGHVIPADQIAAVLCRIPAVTPNDLAGIHVDDRAYAAAEITAFLRAWLVQFRGVRCNEPTWMSLAGPGWHPLQWTWLVSNLGVPVMTGSQAAAARPERETAMAIVVGGDVTGVSDRTLIEYSLRIARAVQSRLLAVRFVHDGGWRFQSADPCPALDEASATALLRSVFAPKTRAQSIEQPSHTRASVLCVAT